MQAASQLPFDLLSIFSGFVLLVILINANNIIIPDTSLTTVKLAASMLLSPNANRHSTELAAKAKRAKTVLTVVFTGFVFKKIPF
jgi:hypothetical protein